RRAPAFEHPIVRTVRVAQHLGREMLVLDAQMPIPHIARLDDVIVNADDDQIFHFHNRLPLYLFFYAVRPLSRPPRRAGSYSHAASSRAPSSRPFRLLWKTRLISLSL